jgi:hypothetical protein
MACGTASSGVRAHAINVSNRVGLVLQSNQRRSALTKEESGA